LNTGISENLVQKLTYYSKEIFDENEGIRTAATPDTYTGVQGKSGVGGTARRQDLGTIGRGV
jgi:hypothetical protein